MKQCAVLFVNPERRESAHPRRLRETGFAVHETSDWPENGAILDYHVIVVHVPSITAAPMVAARLRAKPRFGRRLLIALVGSGTPVHERKAAAAGGFDEVLDEGCDSRRLAARILRGIRGRPELRCALPARSAA